MFFLASHGYRCIAHDRRGHGRSSQPWDGNEMNTYADDLAALIESLDLQDAILVGFSTGGGEVARYIGRHGTKRVAKAALVSSVAPLMLKTASNPGGLPIEVFDGIRAASIANRSQLYKDLVSGRSSASTAQGRRFRRDWWTGSGCRECSLGTRIPTTASRLFRKPISRRTSRNSTSRRWWFTAMTTRSSRSTRRGGHRPSWRKTRLSRSIREPHTV